MVLLASYFSTLAYFTARDEIKNHFTIGSIRIELYEPNFFNPEYDEHAERRIAEIKQEYITQNPGFNGDKIDELTERKLNQHRENAKLVPGKRIKKDPLIIVHENSEDAYIFIGVENHISEYLEPIGYSKEWKHIKRIKSNNSRNKELDIFAYDGTHAKQKVVYQSNNSLYLEPIFEYIDIKPNIDLALDSIENLNYHIRIIGFAHQAKIKGTYNYDIAEEAAINFFTSQLNY